MAMTVTEARARIVTPFDAELIDTDLNLVAVCYGDTLVDCLRPLYVLGFTCTAGKIHGHLDHHDVVVGVWRLQIIITDDQVAGAWQQLQAENSDLSIRLRAKEPEQRQLIVAGARMLVSWWRLEREKATFRRQPCAASQNVELPVNLVNQFPSALLELTRELATAVLAGTFPESMLDQI
jgi:hypothetical protein